MALAISSATRRLLHAIPGVQGVARGYKERDGKPTTTETLVVFVAEKRPLQDVPPNEHILPQIHGLRTDVQEATFRPMTLQGGDPCGSEGNRQKATLGLVLYVDGLAYGLTNEHVPFDERHPERPVIGRGITSPGDGSSLIGHVTAAVSPSSGQGDAALVRLDALRDSSRTGGLAVSAQPVGGARSTRTVVPPVPQYACTIRTRESLGVLRGIASLALGQEAWKVGASTGFTEAPIWAVDTSLWLDYGTRGRLLLTGQVLLRRPDRAVITGPGDSGAVWISREHRAGALLYGACERGAYSVATDLGRALGWLAGPKARIAFTL